MGVEKFVPFLESLSSLGLEGRNLGCPRNFAGMSRTPGCVQKLCAKKGRARFSFSEFVRILVLALHDPKHQIRPFFGELLFLPKKSLVCNVSLSLILRTQ